MNLGHRSHLTRLGGWWGERGRKEEGEERGWGEERVVNREMARGGSKERSL